jgi:hypothetical protein
LRATQVFSLARTSQVSSTVYAGTDHGVFKSTDAGTSWLAASSGITRLAYANWVVALAVDPLVPANLYAGTSNVECGYGAGGVFKSADGSLSWTDTGLVSCISDVAIDPQVPGTVYAATWYSGVVRSTDGGTSWIAANAGLPSSPYVSAPYVAALAMDPQAPRTLFAAISFPTQGLFKSVDGGNTWKLTGFDQAQLQGGTYARAVILVA